MSILISFSFFKVRIKNRSNFVHFALHEKKKKKEKKIIFLNIFLILSNLNSDS